MGEDSNNRSAVWGGATGGLVVGIILGIVQGNFRNLLWAVLIGAGIGFLAEVLARLAGYLKQGRRTPVSPSFDAEAIARETTTKYLRNKLGREPTANEMADAMERHERWIGTIFSKCKNRQDYEKVSESLYKTPPEDFQ